MSFVIPPFHHREVIYLSIRALDEVEGWNYISTFYFLVKNSRKYVNLCEKVAFIALKDTKGPEIWLEANTERSENNPGRSLGIYRAYSDCCLEDSTSQRT